MYRDKCYLKTFLHEAANNRDPQGDHRMKHIPPPPTRFRGTPSSLETSQIIIFKSVGEQDASKSPF